MPISFKMQRPARLTALLVALCYLWFGAVVPFQHTHGVCDDADSVPVPAAAFIRPVSVSATHSHQISPAKRIVARCLACEWQTITGSPALPISHWNFTPEFAPRVPTILPRYLPNAPVSTSSRGPPAV